MARTTDPTAGTSARTAFSVLAGLLALTAAFSLLFAIAPSPDAELRSLDLVVGILLLAMALATQFVMPRIPGGWGLDAMILALMGIACWGAAIVPTGESQVLTGLGLMLATVFAAYFRPRSRFLVELGLGIVGYAMAAVVNPRQGSPVGPFVICAVIAAVSLTVSVLVGRLHDLALRDPLTGALNRHGLVLLAEPLAFTASRSGTPVTVGLIDLDDFKAYNDAHGHAAGDQLLVDVAGAWRAQLRRNDLFVRYGGDEFAVVLPGMDEPEGRSLAARVRATGSGPWSVGFARWDPDEDLDAALSRADAAMFRQKRADADG